MMGGGSTSRWWCSICLEEVVVGDEHHQTGAHVPVALKCGHVFGRSCIERWISKSSAKCPQCNAPAKKRDMRRLYLGQCTNPEPNEVCELPVCTSISGTNLQANLQSDSHLNTSNNQQSSSTDKLFIIQLLQEISVLKRQIRSDQKFGTVSASQILHPDNSSIIENIRTVGSDLVYYSIGGSLYRYSIAGRGVEPLVVPPNDQHRISDLKCSPWGDNLVCAVWRDKSVVQLISGRSVVASSKPADRCLWSCEWDQKTRHVVLVGCGDGAVLAWDIRNPSGSLIQVGGSLRGGPVHSITGGGALGCTFREIFCLLTGECVVPAEDGRVFLNVHQSGSTSVISGRDGNYRPWYSVVDGDWSSSLPVVVAGANVALGGRKTLAGVTETGLLGVPEGDQGIVVYDRQGSLHQRIRLEQMASGEQVFQVRGTETTAMCGFVCSTQKRLFFVVNKDL